MRDDLKCAAFMLTWLVLFGIACICNRAAVWVGFFAASIIMLLLITIIDIRDEMRARDKRRSEEIKELSRRYLEIIRRDHDGRK